MHHKTVCLVGLLVLSSALVHAKCFAGQPASGKKGSSQHIDRLRRAGNPQAIAWYARPSVNKHYTAYYLGGGAAIKGEYRHPEEGTWGLDYAGAFLKKRINLGWWHGRREQDGGGSYKTDGPHLLGH
jgi:hypothetical protein